MKRECVKEDYMWLYRDYTAYTFSVRFHMKTPDFEKKLSVEWCISQRFDITFNSQSMFFSILV